MPENTYNPEVDADKMIDAKTLEAALERFRYRVAETPLSRLKKDPATGRYDNSSISRWLDSYSDAGIYGIRDFGDHVEKTGDNVGMVLEFSTPTTSGVNDYRFKKLFMCPRCNGGVDADGMPYVTAIEHVDQTFTTEEDTFVITPVYWRKVTPGDGWIDWQYSDSDYSSMGFDPCEGAYAGPDGTKMRPYILRACYMSSTSGFDSRSGRWPAASGWWTNGSLPVNSVTAKLAAYNGRNSRNLCGWSNADRAYAVEFWRLMTGDDGPFDRVGMRSHPERVNVRFAQSQDDGHETVRVTFDSGEPFHVGETVSYESGGSFVPFGLVLEVYNNGRSAIVSNPKDIDIMSGTQPTLCQRMSPWINGCLDSVMGTFGELSADDSWSTLRPVRFQNMEFGNGLADRVYNLFVDGEDGGDFRITVYHDYQAAIAGGVGSGTLDVLDGPTISMHVEQGRCSTIATPRISPESVNSYGIAADMPVLNAKGVMVGRGNGLMDDPDEYAVMLSSGGNGIGHPMAVDMLRPRLLTYDGDIMDDDLDLCSPYRIDIQPSMTGCRASTLARTMVAPTNNLVPIVAPVYGG